ncbi:hypothetical protein AUJ63_04970 [Candidatus Pacearchaeota archaeon CG1_02_35_32]|nr:MAG: hypothetical protein AUJ63_04970 [Candidatus Pacearchaeota archaeon CG1_02_35_32]
MGIVKIQSAGVLVFRRNKGRIEYLLLKHSTKGRHWGPPKGRLGPEEKQLDGALREVKEEAGLKLTKRFDFKHIDKYKFMKDGENYDKKVFYFLGEVKDQTVTLSPEHLDYSWSPIEETIEKLKGQSLIKRYNEAHRFLSKKDKTKKKRLVFASYPKCGRTWVTMILGRIIQTMYGFGESDILSLEKMSSEIRELPEIRVVHEDNPHLKDNKKLSRDKIKYSKDSVIFLVRDPRDVIVSFYFHEHNRKKRYPGTISDFLFRKKGGFDSMIDYFNIWIKNKEVVSSFLLVKYEDVMKDTFQEVKKILKFIGLSGASSSEIEDAINFSSFSNMQRMEKEDRFGLNRLSPGDVKDLDTYKTRRGIIGGYKDYLAKKEISILNEKMKKLSPYFGYS